MIKETIFQRINIHNFIINLEMNLKIGVLNTLYEFLLAISQFYLYLIFAFLLKLL